MMRRALSGLSVLVMLVAASCSVSTPRDGWVAESAGAPEVQDEASRTAGRSSSGIAAPSSGAGGERSGADDDVPGAESNELGAEEGPASAGDGSGSPSAGSPAGPSPTGSATQQQQAPDASRPTVGVTDDRIVISVSLPLSTPGRGQLYEQWWHSGVRTWQEDVNANGGIHGRQIILKKVDNKGTADGATAACKEHLSNGSFVSLNITGTEAETDCVDAAGRSQLNGSGVRRSPGWRHSKSILLIPSWGERAAEFLRGPLGLGDTKIGVIWVEDNTHTPTYEGFKAKASELGFDIVGVERVPVAKASYFSELSRLRGTGAETLAMLAGVESLTLLRDLRAMGWRPNIAGVPGAGDEVSKASAELYEGLRTVRPWAASDSRAFRDYKAKAEKYGTTQGLTSTAMLLYGQALVLGEVLRVAGPDLTQQSFEVALNSIDGYTAEGVFPPVSWTPDRAFGIDGAFPLRCCSGEREWTGDGPPRARF